MDPSVLSLLQHKANTVAGGEVNLISVIEITPKEPNL